MGPDTTTNGNAIQPLLSQLFERHESQGTNLTNKIVNVTAGQIEEPEILKEKSQHQIKLKLLPGKSDDQNSMQNLKKSESSYKTITL